MYMYYTNMYLHVMQYCLNWGPIHVQFGTKLSCKASFQIPQCALYPAHFLKNHYSSQSVECQNIKTRCIVVGFHILSMFVRLYAQKAKWSMQVLK